MIRMEFIAEIRRRHFVDGESISSIARSLKKSRPTVRKALKTLSEPIYRRASQPIPKLGAFQAQLEQWLDIESRFRSASGVRRSGCSKGCRPRVIGVATIRCSVS